jgi:UDP-N-acetylmuramoyl-L-alanyl-D-glutamate--2,6-diaminopimelate ligase
MTIKSLITSFTPKPLLQLYHWTLALIAVRYYQNPSERLIVIGVTGTSGKSTTCELIYHILKSTGQTVGLASGIRFDDGRESVPNNTKMTMVGRFRLQQLLSRMVQHGCRYAVIEVTSLGISQYRHLGIHFDLVLITNFWSEHDTAHGGLENYKQAKAELFRHLMRRPVKLLPGAPRQRIAITNMDDTHYPFFSSLPADHKLTFSLHQTGADIITAENIAITTQGSDFTIQHQAFHINLLGEHNVSNALAAISVGVALELPLADCATALSDVRDIPGRLERLEVGQDYTVIVDYAFEPVAMKKLYAVIKDLPHNKIIHVLGTTGGGRDAQRGGILGGMAADFADYVIATDEDPYDDEPMSLIQRVATGAQNHGKELDKDLFVKVSRLDGITKAIDLAQTGDIVLITGKGSEGTMAVANGKKIPWDDREVARAAIQNKIKS